MTMERSITNKVQWGILALSAALLAGAAHAQTAGEPLAEGTAVAQPETTAHTDGSTPHRIRVGVAPLKAQMNTLKAPHGVNLDEPLRGLLMSQLTGPLEVMPLTENDPETVEAEAREKECDYVLHTSITRQARPNGKFVFLHGASQMPIPMVGAGRGMVGAPSSVTAGALLSGAGGAARVVKARDDISLDYRLIATQTPAPALAGSLHTRATEDGQDVITPLIEQEALAVLNAIRQKAIVR
jgi:hypothetical protein